MTTVIKSDLSLKETVRIIELSLESISVIPVVDRVDDKKDRIKSVDETVVIFADQKGSTVYVTIIEDQISITDQIERAIEKGAVQDGPIQDDPQGQDEPQDQDGTQPDQRTPQRQEAGIRAGSKIPANIPAVQDTTYTPKRKLVNQTGSELATSTASFDIPERKKQNKKLVRELIYPRLPKKRVIESDSESAINHLGNWIQQAIHRTERHGEEHHFGAGTRNEMLGIYQGYEESVKYAIPRDGFICDMHTHPAFETSAALSIADVDSIEQNVNDKAISIVISTNEGEDDRYHGLVARVDKDTQMTPRKIADQANEQMREHTRGEEQRTVENIRQMKENNVLPAMRADDKIKDVQATANDHRRTTKRKIVPKIRRIADNGKPIIVSRFDIGIQQLPTWDEADELLTGAEVDANVDKNYDP